ncbi:MAG: BrnT family toxin [Defluviitaleaceae bacterium]|nr:BrnT family toxin [Defluviitaleaceae bacterium]
MPEYFFHDMIFSWDENKANSNMRKHGITFREAMTVFNDSNILYMYDDEHSDEEERFVVLGISKESNLLVVCHCYRNNDTIIRIISARKATNAEGKDYWR